MENQLINIEELEIGDEILTLTQQPKYLKLVEVPRKSKKGWSWRPLDDRYISVKCKVNVDITQRQGTKYDHVLRQSVPYTYDMKSYKIEAPEHDSPVEKFDLNFKQIWLVKRENNN
jgi:hypothetical protein